MKAITVWQPYATLLAIGLKEFETRCWGTSYRGPLIIHAAKKWDEDREFDFSRVLDLLHEHDFSLAGQSDEQIRLLNRPIGETLGKALGVVDLVACRHTPDGGNAFENAVGHFGPGRFGWKCAKPRLFPEPIVCTGRQGLWTPDHALTQAAQQLIAEPAMA